MRFRPACFFLSLLVLTNAAVAQDPPRRDPQAVIVLERALATMRGFSPPPIADVTVVAQAKIFEPSGESTTETMGTITIKILGTDKQRIDWSSGTSQISHVRNGRRAVSDVNGEREPLPRHTFITGRSEHLPLFSELADWTNPSMNLAFEGIDTIAGRAAIHIRIGGISQDVHQTKPRSFKS